MIDIVYRYKKVEKTVKVNDNFIILSYGDKVNEFNESLKVVDATTNGDTIFIKLEQF